MNVANSALEIAAFTSLRSPPTRARRPALLTAVFALVSACGDATSGSGATASGGTSTGTGGTLPTTSIGATEPTATDPGSSTSGGLCGNGMVDPQELCDTAILEGEPGACVTSCNDGVFCTSDTPAGVGTCSAVCTYDIVEACEAGDGCCPAGCTPESDPDCSTTCGDGVLDAIEQCDVGIPLGMPGSCVLNCDDGLACTTDVLLNPGTCGAECANTGIAACYDGDGCCPVGCDMDTDCTSLSRIKQSVITDNGQEAWARNGYWNGDAYANWTAWTGQGLTQLVPELPGGQAYRGIDYVVLADDRVKVTALQVDGKTAWSRYGTWDGNGYSGWTAWSEQFGDLTQIVPGQPAPQSYRAFDHVALPDGRLKQTLLTFDGKKIWYRYGTWDGAKYTGWTDWSDEFGDLTQLIPGQGAEQSFRSYNHFVFVNNRMKVQVLGEDGRTAWHRYAEWNGVAYANWTDWTDQWGDLSNLLPGKGTDQVFLALDEGALAGVGVPSGCQNGCDDDDPCTADACVGNSCQHALVSCDDNDLCTDDVCVDGVCQNLALSCDDGNVCTIDACENGICQHGGANCDDGNPCTDDMCSGGGCQHSDNDAPCGDGGQCESGTCQAQSCECTFGCKDSCGEACNDGATCADDAHCSDGACVCNGQYCGGKCCPANFSVCGNGEYKCCPITPVACEGKCGSFSPGGGCPVVKCICNPGTVCDDPNKPGGGSCIKP
jgi:hypothetical protein